jgi:outer membrane protein assembly factor BamB
MADALTRRWRIEVGEGYATPLVVGDTVYGFTRRAGNEVVTAVDAGTGAERWRSAYPAPKQSHRCARLRAESDAALP